MAPWMTRVEPGGGRRYGDSEGAAPGSFWPWPQAPIITRRHIAYVYNHFLLYENCIILYTLIFHYITTFYHITFHFAVLYCAALCVVEILK